MIYRGQMGTDPNSLRANIAAVFKNKIGWEKSSTVLTFRNPSNTNVYMWEVTWKDLFILCRPVLQFWRGGPN